MDKTFKAPLSGRPRTTEKQDSKGQPIFTITPRELTPLRAKAANDLWQCASGVLLLVCGFIFIEKGKLNQAFFNHTFIPALIAAGVLWKVIPEVLKKKTTIVMTVDAISVKRWYGWKSYERNLAHSFVMWPHDKTNEEYERNAFEIQQAANKGKLIQKKYYYVNSFHIALSHGGHRRDLLTVFGQKEAIAVLARLQFCDALLDEAMNIGRGASKNPDDDWKNGPGGFNE